MSGGGGGEEVDPLEETAAQKELSKIAIDKYNRYQQVFAPLENRLMAEVRTTGAEFQQGMGQAAIASRQQFGRAQDQQRTQSFARGEGPASGSFLTSQSDLGNQEATSAGLNAAGMRGALETQEARGLLGITGIGRGQSGNALQQYGTAANAALSQAEMDASTALDEALADQRLTGQVVGGATALAGGWLQDQDFFGDSGLSVGQAQKAGLSPQAYKGL